jgi:hypothetical protein
MRREAEFFEEAELVLVYAAKRLKEALSLEAVLDAGAIDYAVVPSPYMGGLLFPSQRVGAFFYVAPECADRARLLMKEKGFKPI